MNAPMREGPVPSQFAPPGGGFRAEDILNLLRRNIWLIVAICATTLAVTASYLSVQPDIYRAQAAMELTDRQSARELAGSIVASQSAEIDLLQAMLAERGAPPA